MMELIKSALIPPKPSFTFSEEYGDKKYTFELSRDFIPFNSHSEADPSFLYKPFSDEEFTGFEQGLPYIAIAPDYDEIYDAVERFENGEDVNDIAITKCGLPCFAFTVRFEKFGEMYYAYAFASGTARESEMLFVSYEPSLSGTALEQKLFSVLDNAAASYIEEDL